MSVGGTEQAACSWPAAMGQREWQNEVGRAAKERPEGVCAGRACGRWAGVTPALAISGELCSGFWETNWTFLILGPFTC